MGFNSGLKGLNSIFSAIWRCRQFRILGVNSCKRDHYFLHEFAAILQSSTGVCKYAVSECLPQSNSFRHTWCRPTNEM